MTFDHELPAGFQDADFDAASLTAQANHESRLRKRGICTHGWIQGPPGPPNAPTTVWTCNYCGKVFPTEQAIHAARNSALHS